MHGEAEPDEGHAERHDDRGQLAQLDQRADARRRRRCSAARASDAEQRRVVQPGRGDAGDEADEGADREVEVVDAEQEHLRDGGERDRHREVEQQVEAEIAHRRAAAARRSRRAAAPATAPGSRLRRQLRRQRHASARNEACRTFSSVISARGEVGDDARRRGRRRRGRSARARPSRWCTRGRCGPRAASARIMRVDLLLGADVDAAHRVVHQHDARRRSRARGRTAPSAGCRRRATGSGCRRRGCGCRCVLRQSSAKRALAARGRSAGRRRKRRERARRVMLRGDRPEREDAVGLPVAGDERHRRRRPRRPSARLEDLHQQLGLAVAAEAGEADDLAAVGDELAGRRRGRAGGRGPRGWRRSRGRRRRPRSRRGRRRCPWRATRLARSKAAARSSGDDPARRASPRCGRRCARISPSRCEIRMTLPPLGDEAADVGEQLRRRARVERRGRLVEDDQPRPARR